MTGAWNVGSGGCGGHSGNFGGGFGGSGPGGAGDGPVSHDDPTSRNLAAATGGNGACHCVHVSELLTRVDALELQNATTGRGNVLPRGTANNRGEDPWQPGYEPNRPPRDAGAPRGRAALLLRLEKPLGSKLQQGKSFFDDKLTTSDEYRFNGVKGGFA